VLFAPAAALLLLAPDAYRGIATVATLAGTFGCTLFLANIARRLGRATEARLTRTWGAQRSVVILRHSDLTMDASTKARRHRMLEAAIANWRAPTTAQEADNPQAADVAYQGAVTWLISQTRDARRYPLLLRENTTYGFWRNMRGLRWAGLLSAVATLAFTMTTEAFAAYEWTALVSAAIALIAGLAWVFVVTDAAVRDAADAYARALFDCCDQLN